MLKSKIPHRNVRDFALWVRIYQQPRVMVLLLLEPAALNATTLYPTFWPDSKNDRLFEL
jgi:hypothetical protein